MSEVSEVSKRKKLLQTAALVIGVIGLTVGLVYLLQVLESYLVGPLENYALQAYLIVFVVTLLSSCTIFFPAPGVAIVMAVASKWDPAVVAVVASIGGTVGELTGYYVGYLGRKIIIAEHLKGYNQAVNWMNRYGLWAVFFFALIPVLPFDIVGLAAGALRVSVGKFLGACWAGRLPRSFLEAYVGAGIFQLIFPSWFL